MDKAQIKAKFERLKSGRTAWNGQFEILGEYISQVKQNFEGSPEQGQFMNGDIFDSTGTFAAHNAASALLGMLWPGTAKQSIEISPPDDLDISAEVQAFYRKMTDKTVRAMDDPRANLSLALDEYMLDQVINGTSGVGVEKGYESKLLYKPYGVREMFIEEGRNGKVAEVWLLFDWPLSRVVSEYGVDKLSQTLKDKVKNGKLTETVTILVMVAPRTEMKAKRGKLAMPVQSLHMEYKNDLHVMREEGFEEFPIAVGRFRKLNYEKYGRSPGMNALPDIRECNALREAVIIATEKNLDPPMGVYGDGVMGGGIVDTSAGAITVVNASANMGAGNPIFPLVTVGSIPDAIARLEELRNAIAQHFHIDRLIDFNNEQEMTFGEAQIRNQIRTASLSSLFSRQIAEVLTPVIERSVNILFRMGEFGYIRGTDEEQEALAQGKTVEYVPEVIAKRLEDGADIYQVTYKTQAANASRAEEYMAILDVMRVCGEAMAVDQSIVNRVDFHKGVKQIASIRGVDILRSDDEVESMQAEQQKQQQEAQELVQAQAMAGAAKDAASAGKDMRA